MNVRRALVELRSAPGLASCAEAQRRCLSSSSSSQVRITCHWNMFVALSAASVVGERPQHHPPRLSLALVTCEEAAASLTQLPIMPAQPMRAPCRAGC
jgi:hypothetical protein